VDQKRLGQGGGKRKERKRKWTLMVIEMKDSEMSMATR
jgi:hypothetical protein